MADLPLALHTLTAAELEQPTGTPATRDDLRAHMSWCQSLIAEHWREFGGLQGVIAVEAGLVYRWSR